MLECGLLDSHDIAGLVYETNGTFNGYHTDGFSDQRIDHIFVSPAVKVIKYGILTDTYRTPEVDTESFNPANAPAEVTVGKYRARTPSDHFPVRATVEL